MSNLKKNLSFQTLYQIFAVIVPLVTSPYISRVLQSENLGIYSYTYSIVNYFMLFSMLGIANYGTKTIAANKKDRNKTFNQIYTMQLFTSLCFVVIYFIMIVFLNENKNIFMLQSLWIFSCLFDVSWYFFGKENFQITVTRNFIVKVITVISIFVLVQTKNDLWKYTLIMSLGACLSNFYLLIIALKENQFRCVKFENFKHHIKPNLVLFIPILAMSFYHIMDKTMLGWCSTNVESGIYYNADKIINVPLYIVTGIGTVMLPKISYLKSNEKSREIFELLHYSLDIFLCFSIALCFGIISISSDFVPVFFGSDFDGCVSVLSILAFVVIFKSVSNMYRTEYLIPFNLEKVFVISVSVGALVNIICNYLFIYSFNMGANGAALGTLLAEAAACIIQIVYSEKKLKMLYIYIYGIGYIFIGIAMFIVIKLTNIYITNILWRLIFEIILGSLIYTILCCIYWTITKNKFWTKCKMKLVG